MSRMLRLAGAGVALAGVAVLAACTHEAGLLGLNPDYRFGYDDKGGSAALSYGLPNSDDLALMLECPKGTGRIELSDTVRDKTATSIVLTAGGQKTTVPVRQELGNGDNLGPELWTGRLTSKSAALQAFRRTGVLTVVGGKARYVITVLPDRKAGVERFFRECG